MFRLAIPVFHVRSSEAASAYYCDGLGFAAEFVHRPTAAADPCYMGLVRDGARLHLSSFRDDSAPGASAYLLVDDVDELFRSLTGRRVAVAMPPTDQTWGNREMYLRDPDGNKIAFVSAKGADGA